MNSPGIAAVVTAFSGELGVDEFGVRASAARESEEDVSEPLSCFAKFPLSGFPFAVFASLPDASPDEGGTVDGVAVVPVAVGAG